MASVAEYRASKMLDMFVNKHNLKLEIKADKFSIEVQPGLEVSSPESVEMLKFLGFAIKYKEADTTIENLEVASSNLSAAVDEAIPPVTEDSLVEKVAPTQEPKVEVAVEATLVSTSEVVADLKPTSPTSTFGSSATESVAAVDPRSAQYKTPKFGS